MRRYTYIHMGLILCFYLEKNGYPGVEAFHPKTQKMGISSRWGRKKGNGSSRGVAEVAPRPVGRRKLVLRRRPSHIMKIDECEAQPGCYLTGQVVAAIIQVQFTPRDFAPPASWVFQDSTCTCLSAHSPALLGGGGGVLIGLKRIGSSSLDLIHSAASS